MFTAIQLNPKYPVNRSNQLHYIAVINMSLTEAERFECPYCMAYNDIEVDLSSDIGQQQIVDCQICCQPIEIMIEDTGFGIRLEARRDDD
jgi:hypothetical protein